MLMPWAGYLSQTSHKRPHYKLNWFSGGTSPRFTGVFYTDQVVDQSWPLTGKSVKTPQWGLARPPQRRSPEAVQGPESGTVSTWWVPFVGRSCYHTSTWLRSCPQRTSWWSPWCLAHENLGTDVCVVSKHGSRHWVHCTELSWVTAMLPHFPSCSLTSLEMAQPSLVPSPFGPFLGHMFLVLVDAHSKWMEVFLMSSATIKATIEKLRTVFAQFGLPNTVVTDNGTCFTSEEFADFLQKNGILHLTSAPYHPSTNGLAERAVQSFKQGMKKFTKGTLSDRISRFLFHYRNTPHSTTGVTPAELLLDRTPHSRLDLFRPDFCTKMSQRQQQQKQAHDSRARTRHFTVGDLVYPRGYGRGQSHWIPAKIVQKTNWSCVLQNDGGLICRWHQDQLRKRFDTTVEATFSDADPAATESLVPLVVPLMTPLNISDPMPEVLTEPAYMHVQNSPEPLSLHDSPPKNAEVPQPDTRRYPSRERRLPERLTYNHL